MKFTIFPAGSRVRVASYSPFKGLTGTVQKVYAISGWDEPFCFYLIALEGTRIGQPVWFLYEEVECVSLQGMDYLASLSEYTTTFLENVSPGGRHNTQKDERR